MMNSTLQAETPQDLILLLTPLKREHVEGEYDSYLSHFYSQDYLFPLVEFATQNIDRILAKPEVQSQNNDWAIDIIFAMKYALMEGKHFEAAVNLFNNYMIRYFEWLLDQDFVNQEDGLDCKYTISFIVLETLAQVESRETINTKTMELWNKISARVLHDLVIFPFEPFYLEFDETGNVVNEKNGKSTALDYLFPGKEDFANQYVDIIKILKKNGMTPEKIVEHVLYCLKIIYDNVQYFSQENQERYLLYIEKLKAVIGYEYISSEIYDLYHFFCEVQIEDKSENGDGFYAYKISKNQTKELTKALDKCFDWCITQKRFLPIKDFWEEIYYQENDDKIELLIFCYNKFLSVENEIAKNIIGRHIKLDLLFKKNNYKLIASLYKNGLIYNLKGDYFEVAYSVNECGDYKEARRLYEEAIANNEAGSSVYNNLGVIFAKSYNDPKKAIEYYTKASELNPKDSKAANNLKYIKETIKEAEERPQRLKDEYFKKTKTWHKKLLFTIYKLGKVPVSIDMLASAVKQTDTLVERNIAELMKLGMLKLEKDVYAIDPIIEKLVSDFIDPKLERQIIQVDRSHLYRPIFFHESEIHLYRVLLELFPQHFVFPNISLKTIVDVEKLRGHLSGDHLNYLFMAHVDFAIISTSTYIPVLAIEKDSMYHDNDTSLRKDEMKNSIFKLSGIPLIRIRFNKGMTAEKLKQEIRNATKELILDTQKDKNNQYKLLEEVDVRNFGVSLYSDIDIDLLQDVWSKIVGEGISKKSKVLDLKDKEIFYVSIAAELETIIDFSKEKITTKLKDVIPTIQRLEISYY